MSEINGHEYQLLKIFSSDFEYHIPAYQRPYAWTTEETNTLFDDLYGFFSSEKEDENYFLGSIVLIKETANRRADVIDGQQRLTTLTILFSVLADNLTDPKKKASCMKMHRCMHKVSAQYSPSRRSSCHTRSTLHLLCVMFISNGDGSLACVCAHLPRFLDSHVILRRK